MHFQASWASQPMGCLQNILPQVFHWLIWVRRSAAAALHQVDRLIVAKAISCVVWNRGNLILAWQIMSCCKHFVIAIVYVTGQRQRSAGDDALLRARWPADFPHVLRHRWQHARTPSRGCWTASRLLLLAVIVRPPDIVVGGLSFYRDSVSYLLFYSPATLRAHWTELSQKPLHVRDWVRFEKGCPKSVVSPPPKNPGSQNHLFSTFLTTSQFNGNFNGLYLRNETWYT